MNIIIILLIILVLMEGYFHLCHRKFNKKLENAIKMQQKFEEEKKDALIKKYESDIELNSKYMELANKASNEIFNKK